MSKLFLLCVVIGSVLIIAKHHRAEVSPPAALIEDAKISSSPPLAHSRDIIANTDQKKTIAKTVNVGSSVSGAKDADYNASLTTFDAKAEESRRLPPSVLQPEQVSPLSRDFHDKKYSRETFLKMLSPQAAAELEKKIGSRALEFHLIAPVETEQTVPFASLQSDCSALQEAAEPILMHIDTFGHVTSAVFLRGGAQVTESRIYSCQFKNGPDEQFVTTYDPD